MVAGELLLTVYFAAGMALCFYYLDFTFFALFLWAFLAFGTVAAYSLRTVKI